MLWGGLLERMRNHAGMHGGVEGYRNSELSECLT
jgi:hypothetical protein